MVFLTQILQYAFTTQSNVSYHSVIIFYPLISLTLVTINWHYIFQLMDAGRTFF